MIKGAVIWAVFAVLFSCAHNKTQKAVPTPAPNAETEMFFDQGMHDFGKVKAGETVVFSFGFTNTGNSDLYIENAEADCGCISANIPETPIAPGKKGFVEVAFDSSGMFGKQLKTIEIGANCKEPKHLIIFAEVENENIEYKH